MRRLQNSLLIFLHTRDDIAIFLVCKSAVALSTQLSDLGWSKFCVLCLLMASRTALQNNVMVECSRLFIIIRSVCFFFRCFSVLSTMEVGHSVKHQNLSSGKHTPYHVRQVSPWNL